MKEATIHPESLELNRTKPQTKFVAWGLQTLSTELPFRV